MEKMNLERAAAWVICVAAAILAVCGVFRYALPILLPFLLGILLGAPAKKLACSIFWKHSRHKKLIGAGFYILILAAICLGAFFALERLVGELLRLADSLTQNGEGVFGLSEISDYIANLTERLPIVRDIRAKSGNEELWQSIDAALADSVRGFISGLGAAIPKAATELVAALPRVFVFLAVLFISGFFFSVGGVDLGAIERILPIGLREGYVRIKKRAAEAAIGWLRAYLLILGLTFFELFIGFSVLGVSYSFLAALAVALVDILPVFGVGTVLVPWAAVSLISGDRATGVGLLVLFAIISVVRQFAEPKIVGKSLGLSPVLTLLSMYAGLVLFGIPGMLLSPAVLMFAKLFFFQDESGSTDVL